MCTQTKAVLALNTLVFIYSYSKELKIHLRPHAINFPVIFFKERGKKSFCQYYISYIFTQKELCKSLGSCYANLQAVYTLRIPSMLNFTDVKSMPANEESNILKSLRLQWEMRKENLVFHCMWMIKKCLTAARLSNGSSRNTDCIPDSLGLCANL